MTADRPPEPAVPARRTTRRTRPLDRALRGGGTVLLTACGLVLLYLAYQLWWTDVQAHGDVNAARQQLQQQWASPSPTQRTPVHLTTGQRFALLSIPTLGLDVPVAEGTGTTEVLDHGLVGHLPGSAMPGDQGNMVLAGHRNTHGEPFRHLPRLTAGDTATVETATDVYTYTVKGVIAQTSPDNTSVLRAVPVGSPFSRPGRYLTLMTCTPDYTSWYRFIAFAELTAVRAKTAPTGPSATPHPSATERAALAVAPRSRAAVVKTRHRYARHTTATDQGQAVRPAPIGRSTVVAHPAHSPAPGRARTPAHSPAHQGTGGQEHAGDGTGHRGSARPTPR